MNDDTGLLSIDFLAGFTIFMIAFIIVLTMVSGLLLGLQGKTIDYDAVAYRTGVILAEDAGNPGGPGDPVDTGARGWEFMDPTKPAEKDEVIRMGLAISKAYPNILSPIKVNRFFNNPYYYPAPDVYTTDDYRNKLLLKNFNNPDPYSPTYYHFNVQLDSVESTADVNAIPPGYVPQILLPPPQLYYDMNTPAVGDEATGVNNYGDSRRAVKIKQPSCMVITLPPQPPAYNQKSILISYDLDPANPPDIHDTIDIRQSLIYQIDPINEQTAININVGTNVVPAIGPVKLQDVQVLVYTPSITNPGEFDTTPYTILPSSENVHIYYDTLKEDNVQKWSPILPIANNVFIIIDPGYFTSKNLNPMGQRIDIQCTFDKAVANDLIGSPVYYYSYATVADPPVKIIQPFLIPAVMEVKVW
jgi:hypothetical protein